MGITPTRVRRRKVDVKESRPKRILKALKHPGFKTKWKGAVDHFMKMKMVKQMNGCLRAMRVEEEKKALEVEYKPLYRLKEVRRASVLYDNLPKPRRRPLSIMGMESVSMDDRRRLSALSMYSERLADSDGSESTFSPGASSGQGAEPVNFDEDCSLRASIVPFQEWAALIRDANPFSDEVAQEPTHTDPPSFFPPDNHLQNLQTQPFTDENPQDLPSPTSSEVTITPWNVNLTPKMSQFPDSPALDPFMDPENVEDQEASASVSSQKETVKNAAGDQNSSLPSTPANASAEKEAEQTPSAIKIPKRSRDSSGGSRIPRVPAQKQSHGGFATSQKEARVASEHRSSIPVAVRRHSAEQLATPQNTPSERFAGGMRVIEKPLGPRPRPVETNNPAVPESIQEPAKEPASSSSSSVSSWDLDDHEEDLQRPSTVFTGEYRTRLFHRSGQTGYGPTLRVAASAENIIMGAEDSRVKTAMVTQRSPSSSVRYVVGKALPKSLTQPSGLASHPVGESSNSKEDESSPDHPPVTRNFCRPQVSIEHMPKRDFSGRELSIPRKPLSTRPSPANLFSGSSENPESKSTPPPIPKAWMNIGADSNGNSSSEVKAVDPATPMRDISQDEDHSSGSGVLVQSAPGTAESTASLKPHPPRSSSLQAISDFSMHSESDCVPTGPDEAQLKDASYLRRNVTFDDIVEENPDKEQAVQNLHVVRLPDSKSTRMLDSFRNIFSKTKSGAEKGRGKKDESVEPASAASKDQTASSTKRARTPNEKIDSAKIGPKTKTKYSKLSDGVGWNKNSPNPKSSDDLSPVLVPTPASSLSSIPAPLSARILPEDRTPSFARPTQATRTKAAVTISSKSSVQGGQDTRSRRAHLVAASNGSPQRAGRPQKRVISAPIPIQKNANQTSSGVIEKPGALIGQKNGTQDDGKPSDSEEKNVINIRRCIESLCNKARDEVTPAKREKYLRLALSLQQQMSNYNSVDKEATEAEALLNKKKADKAIAENALFEYFSQVQMQIDEE
ncbi:hypothetical protein MW887_009686 [Aspergillus wentii]|nr:hypothetical protein MW887_009686 [Aspergillus wentii]